MESGPDALEESRLTTNWGNYRKYSRVGMVQHGALVLEEKGGNELPDSLRLESSEKISAISFTLSHADDKTSGQ